MRLPERCRESLVALNVAEADAVEDLRPIACSVDMPIPLDTEPLSPVRVSPAVLLGVGRAVFSAWRDVRSRQLGSVLARRFLRAADQARRHGDVRARLADISSARPIIGTGERWR